MEPRIGGESHHFYDPGSPNFILKEKDLMGIGRKSEEWDLNDWKWDGDLFIASPLNSVPSDCRSQQLLPVGSELRSHRFFSNGSSSSADDIDAGRRKAKGELDKRRRVNVFEEDELNDEAGSLTLNLGEHAYPITQMEVVNEEGKNGKKTKLQRMNSNRPACQVDNCRADLTNAKDYHRRHKVCEMHSKATEALVGNVMQRFCQQCSRFHSLQEFDEGRRSCRRRLAGHNRRRRKNHSDAVGGSSLNDNQASSYLLTSLLRTLSNMHSNCSEQTKDEGLLSHLLRNLASFAGTFDVSNLSRLLQASQGLQKVGSSVAASSELVPALPSDIVNCEAQESSRPPRFTSNINSVTITQDPIPSSIHQTTSVIVAAAGMLQKEVITGSSLGGTLKAVHCSKSTSTLTAENERATIPLETSCPLRCTLAPVSHVENVKFNDIDLNDVYVNSPDCLEGSGRIEGPVHMVSSSRDCPSWVLQESHQSPPQTSNSDSASGQSPSSSSGDTQNRTDRIVFKLFGKDPNDFPQVLRAQILSWLSHSPTDLESYIRPGCIILTVYLRLAECEWEELCCDLSSSLNRLLDVTNDVFWGTGWIYCRIQHQIAFIYNGQVVLDSSLPSQSHCTISSVIPIALSVSNRAYFTVKGFNLCRPTARLLCAFEGNYLVQETISEEGTDASMEHNALQSFSFSCSPPNINGRGFVEVEDNGIGSGFFPFIVAEEDLCSEVRELEVVIDVEERVLNAQERAETKKARSQALEFLHEMGWLLRRSQFKSRLDHMNACLDLFPLTRFKWLIDFSMDHDWCVVVKKLLDVLFEGTVDAGDHSTIELALSEMGLLHRAVRRNSRPMVELLLRYVPNGMGTLHSQQVSEGSDVFFFRPDMVGPVGWTPLHIAACRDDSENVLDALTDDPGLVGIEAWKNARDSTGFAPEDYARLRGHYSYIHLVWKKINKKCGATHLIIDIPGSNQMQMDHSNSGKLTGLQIEKHKVEMLRQYCKICERQVAYRNTNVTLSYRPLVLSMVAVAAVCVCVGLLFHGPPEVLCGFPQFRWELLDFGSI